MKILKLVGIARPSILKHSMLASAACSIAALAPAATFTVIADVDSGLGTLRNAIELANSAAGVDIIEFNIGGGGHQILSPDSALPSLTDEVIIDGSSQPGYSGVPLIEIQGVDAGSNAAGFTVSAANCVIKGLVINGFGQAGIEIEPTATGATVAGNFIGTDITGSSAVPNYLGIRANGSGFHQIGGPTSADRNILSGNTSAGLYLLNDSSDNVIEGNYIGLNASGNAAVANGDSGISITGGSRQQIGGAASGAGNVVSGNAFDGIHLSDTTSVTLQGNFVGTDADGTTEVRNQINGIQALSGCNGLTLGGSAAGSGNVISGNERTGLIIHTADDITLQGNRIGTDVNGAFSLPNLDDGGFIAVCNRVAIGGTAAGARNVFSGNRNTSDRNGFAMQLVLDSVSSVVVQGNRIGTDATGTYGIVNTSMGGMHFEKVDSLMFGGMEPGAGNLVAGNPKYGLVVKHKHINPALNRSTSVTLQGNYFGTDVTGTARIGNSDGNVNISSTNNIAIGGVSAAARNLISGCDNGSGLLLSSTSNVVIQGNYLGTDITGQYAIYNRNNGISFGGTNGLIGGTSPGAANLVSGSGTNGILITNFGTVAAVQGNLVGTDVTGMSAIPNGFLLESFPGGCGIRVESLASATIGGTLAGAPNLVSGNKEHGIAVVGSANATSILGNFIGVDITRVAPLPNENSGVAFIGTSKIGHRIGGTAAGESNLISGNLGAGISLIPTPISPVITYAASVSVNVAGNFIGTLPDGTGALPNGGPGIYVEDGSSHTIGGVTAAHRNLIAGNGGPGVRLTSCSLVGVLGNYIGTEITGVSGLGNDSHGIQIENGNNNTIGGAVSGSRNVIAGNGGAGIAIANGTGNVCSNNYFGVNVTGITALPNASNGVVIEDGGSGNVIGEAGALGRNIIANHPAAGVEIIDSASNKVQNNYIGLDASGATAAANAGDGVSITGGSGNVIGGDTSVYRNLICNNTGVGVSITTSSANLVQGNYINIDVSGDTVMANGSHAVSISGGSDNIVGGIGAGGGNLLSGTPATALVIQHSEGNHVRNNLIGTDASGLTRIANDGYGVEIVGGSGNTIGGPGSAYRNLIVGNNAGGIRLFDTSGNYLSANNIGVLDNGTMVIPNEGHGIEIVSGDLNTIGSTAAGGRNHIAKNDAMGISLLNSSQNTIQSNLIGTQGDGNGKLYNVSQGIEVVNGSDNLIGGASPSARNVIATATNTGAPTHTDVSSIRLVDTSGNTVAANYINIRADGTDVFDAVNGVEVLGGSGNVIGGAAAGSRNVIGGAYNAGVMLDGATTGNHIRGNYLGSDPSGTTELHNEVAGVIIRNGSQNNTVGGLTVGSGNLISGNLLGLQIADSSNNTVAGNLIGTDSSGGNALPNLIAGVLIVGDSFGNLVGGTTSATRNVISGNGEEFFNAGDGVNIDSSATDNIIRGNYIGLDSTGEAALPNRQAGIFSSASGTIIGGVDSGSGNVISGNGSVVPFFNSGIWLDGASGSVVQGNLIGLNASGTASLGNQLDGVTLEFCDDAVIGGSVSGAGNVIAGSQFFGLFVSASPGAQIAGNIIGMNAAGTAALPNGLDGVYLDGFYPEDAELAGLTVGPDNVMSGNAASGLRISGLGAVGHTVVGNKIGTDVTGAVAVANGLDGITLEGGTAQHVIGGTGPGESNLVSGNAVAGISVFDALTSGNLIQANLIGTTVDGLEVLGNGAAGIDVTSASGTLIGGTNPGEGNRIAGNSIGVSIVASTSTLTLANSITTNTLLGIDLNDDGPTANDSGDADLVQNFPILSSVIADAGLTTIQGALSSSASTSFRIEFFGSAAAHMSGFGEGDTFLGSADVITDPSGTVAFSAVLPFELPRGRFVTATATRNDGVGGRTSEFSPTLITVPVYISGFSVE